MLLLFGPLVVTLIAIVSYFQLKQKFLTQNPSLVGRPIAAAFWFPIFQFWGPSVITFSFIGILKILEDPISGFFDIVVNALVGFCTIYVLHGIFQYGEVGAKKLKLVPKIVTWGFVIITLLIIILISIFIFTSEEPLLALITLPVILFCLLYLFFQSRYDKAIDTIFQFGRYREAPRQYATTQYAATNQYAVSNAKPMKTCPYCGEEILAVAKKCKHCGEWLNEEPEQPKKEYMACPVCGEQVEKGLAVCPYCYEPLVDMKQNIPNPECGGMIQPDGETQQEDGPKAIDLGLSVLWAVCNIGGDVDSPIGGLYGWGDPTGEQTSKDANDYIEKTSGQCDKTPQDISGTQNDIATAMWGEGWRMPNRANWEELIEKCKWTKCSVLNAVGYRVEGPNGNSIFLPNTGLRLGDDVSKTDVGYYWTSEMAEGNSGCAYSYYFDIEKYSDVVSTKSYVYSGRAVRPVHEK